MIRVLGTPGSIYKPKVMIGGEPIASFNVQFPVGQLARAACGMKPESVAAGKAGGEITANGEVLFTGDGWGPRGRATSGSLDFGFSLIHPAHRLEGGRAWAPGLHAMSTEHYTFTMGPGGSDSRDSSLFGDIRQIQIDLTKSLADEIPAYIVKAMERAHQERVSANLQEIDAEGSVGDGGQDVIEMLQSIEGLTQSKIAFSKLGRVDISIAADTFAQQLVMNSITANKSAWDLLAMMMSAFGMQIICWPDGTLKACPDFSGCKPPKENRIHGAIIDSWDGAAEYSRSPRGVVVISYGFSRGNSGAQPSSGAQPFDPLAGNEGEYIGTGSGGLFITGLPAWMMPYQQGGLPELPKELVNLYAKQIYSEVKNMGRTFVVSTPIAPDARPGTTYYFEPISKAKNLTDGGEVELPFSVEYAGYCYKIVHTANASGQFHTHWHFRNVFEPEEYGQMVDKAPFFEDEPFKIGAGNGGEGDDGYRPSSVQIGPDGAQGATTGEGGASSVSIGATGAQGATTGEGGASNVSIGAIGPGSFNRFTP